MPILVTRFAADESGVVSVEYGVIAGSIVVAVAAVIGQIGGELKTPFETIMPSFPPRAG